MDQHAFDELTKELARHRNRRSLFKLAFGLGTSIATGTVIATDTEAARRGYSGPKFPTHITSPGPSQCTPDNCYGCHQCSGNVCTDNPKQNCYDHTAECLAAYCHSDGGCGYGFDCRVKDGCCGHGQMCNSEGQCVCDPSICCGIECPGCQDCSDGKCVRNPANCYDHTDQCRASVCDPDGGCSYPFDCNVKANCCTTGQTCNTSTGQCELSG